MLILVILGFIVPTAKYRVKERERESNKEAKRQSEPKRNV